MGAFMGLGSLAGGLVGGIGSLLGGNSYGNAAKQANQQLGTSLNQMTQSQQPYMTAGANAAGTITNDLQNGTGFAKQFNLSDFLNSDAYKFANEQGTNAINNSAAAAGNMLSGATLKGLAGYSSGLASQNYNQAFQNYLAQSNQQYNQLFGMAGLGQNSATNLNSNRMGIAGMQNQNSMNAAQAHAEAIGNMFNSIGGGISNATTLGGMYKMMGGGGGSYGQGVGSGYTQALSGLGRAVGPVDVQSQMTGGYLGY